MEKKYKFFDIAANLCDNQFDGIYHDKKRHENDVELVIKRAEQYGVDQMLIVGGDINDTLKSLEICKKRKGFTSTVGIHPCKASEPFKKNYNLIKYYQEMEDIIKNNFDKISAIGECGLDYDRLEWSTKEEQLKVFPYHFDLAKKYNLPMYLHSRNAEKDFINIVEKNRDKFKYGVVHSFTGTKTELEKLIKLDLFIGINGCSLKTKENINNIKLIPVDRLMIETDAPYCEIRKSHFSSKFVDTKFLEKPYKKYVNTHLVKGRNEPCKIIQVLEVISNILNIPEKELSNIIYQTTCKIFNKK